MIVMMKPAFLVLATICVLAQAVLPLPNQTADKTHLTKQKDIYELFWHVDQPTVFHPELYQKARTFSIVENVGNYNDTEALNEFVALLKHGMLPRGHVFTVMNTEMRHQAVVLFRVLYSAVNFEVFYNTAVWARFHVNELMYVYALSVAVIQRPDTRHIKLPPMYEVLPHFYFNEEVMQKAYNIAMGDIAVGSKKTVGGTDQYYVFPANYSGWYLTRPDVPEQKLAYFTEDVGLNSFYFLGSHNYPPFMHSHTVNVPKIRGEFYFYFHKQLLTRYYLERLCHDMGEIDYVSVHRPIVTGYYPNIHFRNGLSFPHRETNAVVPLEKQKYVQVIDDLHTRISTAIDIGYVLDTKGNKVDIYTKEGLNILGNIVQGNADSINRQLYGQLDLLVRKVLGFGFESNVKYHVVPSALEIFSTSMRDPVFYSMYKNILDYYHRYKHNLPKYTREELTFPGVKVDSVTVDKLTTYFDNFESMLNNGVSIRNHKEAKNTVIKARQHRLNHKPYSYHITVSSEQNTKAMVRIFLGPKVNEHGHELSLENNYMNFLQMDEFVVDLKSGTNTIDRDSHESIAVVPDEVPSEVFYDKVVSGLEGRDTFTYSAQPYGFPERLLLPIGKREGMPFKLFVMVSPLDESNAVHMDSPVWGRLTTDGHSLGFPLDRPVDPLHFDVPNMYLKDVVVYHKEMEELNVPH